jgi:adenylate cyclase
MPDLIAQGTHSRERWRRTLPERGDESTVVLGRTGPSGWTVPWDDRISREHAILQLQTDGTLAVSQAPLARNPIFYRGKKRDSFVLQPGEHFVIGQTTFTLAVRPEVNVSDARLGVTEHVYDVVELRRKGFRDSATRIEALGRLPDIIGGSSSDDELLFRVVSLLMQSIPAASAVAILQIDPTADESTSPRILHYDNRLPEADGPQPSARIVRTAAKRAESVLHLWAGGDGSHKGEHAYTASEEVDWAFGVPICGEGCEGWVIYVAGQLSSLHSGGIGESMQAAPDDLQDDVKFTELVGTTVASLRQSRVLQRRQMGMRRFFAPVVMDAMSGRDPEEVLQPRETDVSVLFCDLRGFTRQSEESQGRLLELLQRVSDALGVMTGEILRAGGVVGDFHGDAAMGFWGWPIDQPDAVLRAASAALAIRESFRGQGPEGTTMASSLHGFRCGVGLATGRAVAGRIGTVDQVKVTAFGPVVNLASRLEGMTKTLGVELLIDEVSARWVREHVDRNRMRVRKLAIVRPAGFATAIEVSQLLPAADQAGSPSDEDITAYEDALRWLVEGKWDRAFEQLHRVSANDRAKDFLTATILRNGRMPPAGWDGVIDIAKAF